MGSLILVTGGTGKTGRRLVSELRGKGVECRVASRGATVAEGERPFDWTLPESWDGALEGVSTAYLVAPSAVGEPAPVMIDFLRRAQKRGVSRFVLLSAAPLPAGGPAMGQVHLWLKENAAEWTVLRPSWFMQNFSEGQHLASIQDEDGIYSATEDGRVPFVSADDIATAAMAVLTSEDPFNSDFILTGDRPLSYDEVAERIGMAVGRRISHRRLSSDELAARYRLLGLPPVYAEKLAAMDRAIAEGAEDRTTDSVKFLLGRPPISFDDFVEASAASWSAPVR
jgi:ergot alkaloid biosynthesis protein